MVSLTYEQIFSKAHVKQQGHAKKFRLLYRLQYVFDFEISPPLKYPCFVASRTTNYFDFMVTCIFYIFVAPISLVIWLNINKDLESWIYN